MSDTLCIVKKVKIRHRVFQCFSVFFRVSIFPEIPSAAIDATSRRLACPSNVAADGGRYTSNDHKLYQILSFYLLCPILLQMPNISDSIALLEKNGTFKFLFTRTSTHRAQRQSNKAGYTQHLRLADLPGRCPRQPSERFPGQFTLA